jgi:hypothetical protein
MAPLRNIKTGKMKRIVFALALFAIPTAVVAQTYSDVGRVKEYKERQAEMARQDQLNDNRSGRRPANLSDAERRQIGYAFAECLVGKYPRLTQEYVLGTYDRENADEKFGVFSDFECIPDHYKDELIRLRMGNLGGRFTFAEILLTQETPEIPDNFLDVPMLAHAEPMSMANYKKSGKLSEKEYAALVERSIGDVAMSRIGECSVRGDLVNSKALLATKIGSPEEKIAVQNLVPAVSRCIANGSIKILPEQLRGSIALNLYRLLAAKAGLPKDQPDA